MEKEALKIEREQARISGKGQRNKPMVKIKLSWAVTDVSWKDSTQLQFISIIYLGNQGIFQSRVQLNHSDTP
jgi:hypothetical protein